MGQKSLRHTGTNHQVIKYSSTYSPHWGETRNLSTNFYKEIDFAYRCLVLKFASNAYAITGEKLKG